MSVARRAAPLISVPTLVVAVGLLVATVACALTALKAYDDALNLDADRLRAHLRVALSARPAVTRAAAAARRLRGVAFRRALVIVLLGDIRRATLYYPPGAPEPVADVRARGDRLAFPLTRGAHSPLADGAVALFGAPYLRDRVGPVEIYLRPNSEEVGRELGRALPVAATLAGVVALLAAAGGYALNRRALRPLVEVTQALERLGAGDLTPRFVAVRPSRPLERLAAAFNGATAQVEAALARREEADASMRRFIADAGHQLRTPLTVIRGLTTAMGAADADERARCAEIVRAQCLTMGRLIDHLILLDGWERPPDARALPAVDAAQLAGDVVQMFADAHPARRFRFASEGPALAAVEPHELHQALVNLLDNAVKYTAGAVAATARVEESELVLAVGDEGPGMSAETVDRAFDRFYRGERREVEGSGLGLAIVKRAVERAGGTVALRSDAAGSVVTLRVPLAARRGVAAASR